jgi:hypothetical protein
MNRLRSDGSVVSGTVHVGGLLSSGNSLVGNTYVYCDGGLEATRSHFTSGDQLSTAGDFRGNTQDGPLNPGFVAGHMTWIPQDWRGLFGGPALTGQGGLAIICRTSLGPSATVFDPAQIANSSSITGTPVVGYTCQNPTLGVWDRPGPADPDGFNMTTSIRGIVFPEKTRSVLFFGRQQLGESCSGYGVTDPALHRTIAADGQMNCYDPIDSSKASHGYPYASWVWAYDALDLLDVKSGLKAMWDVRPYATWQIPLPFDPQVKGGIVGAAYDPATNRIYVTRYCQDPNGGFFCAPVVDVL